MFTIFGVLVGLLSWLAITVLAYSALGLLDYIRGISDFWAQVIFRELFTPGVGGYFAVYTVNRFVKQADLKWASIGFCSLVATFYIGLSIWIISVLGSEPDFSWTEQILSWLVPVASCIGARLGLNRFGSSKDS